MTASHFPGLAGKIADSSTESEERLLNAAEALPAYAASTDKQQPFEPDDKLRAEVAKAIDEYPLIASLLYDIDLLPEQIKDERRYNYMLAVIGHMKQAAQSASGAISGDEEIAALFRKRDALENPLSADEVDEQIDKLLRKQFAARRAADSTSEREGE